MTKTVHLKQQQQPQPQQPVQIPNTNETCTASKKKKKNKKKSKSIKSVSTTQADMVDAMMNHHVQLDTNNNNNNNRASSSSSSSKKEGDDTFWSSTNNTEERQKIREFWLQLGEEERRSLVKVEKEAVLRKMKEQQKHSCNCSVCGKKRTAIEDELEVLYDAYYEELEQYANHQQQTRGSINPLHAGYLSTDPMYDHTYDDTDPLDDDEDDEDEEDEDDLDDIEDDDDDEDDLDDDDDFEDDEDDEDDDDDELITRSPIAYAERSRFEEMAHIRHTAISRASANGDHFSFGNSLTVKGGILTVADDLLKNDGKKFLDMMERLAERRMQKDDTISDQNTYYPEEDDDDAYEDDDDEDTRTEEQRMEEGRRMFQIFAARMFEQRVLAAYREKVAQERQQRLLEELEEEDRLREEREAKKQKEREKKKDKKRQLKQQQEAERLAREAKKKAEEEAAKREKEKKLEQERQKREQERLRREEEKRQKEEKERLKREEEKKRRAKEEKAEKERKRKENEEKERLEQEKARALKEEKERLEKERIEKERLEKERLEKERFENERLEKERLEKERLEKERLEKERIDHPLVHNTTPPPGITVPVANSPEARQQVLYDALVGSTRPPIGPPPPPPHLPFTHSPHDPMGIFRPTSTSTRRSITSIAPIGQPVTEDPLLTASNMIKGNGSEPTNSFFSNFLFGKPAVYHQPWSNGWTENVHGKLFGDALPDRTTMTLERAKIAYQKLNEIIGGSSFHTLVQLHLMMNDLYMDYPVDIRELYETLSNAPLSGFQCLNHNQHGMIVLLR